MKWVSFDRAFPTITQKCRPPMLILCENVPCNIWKMSWLFTSTSIHWCNIIFNTAVDRETVTNCGNHQFGNGTVFEK